LYFGANNFNANNGVFYCNGNNDFSNTNDNIRSRSLCQYF